MRYNLRRTLAVPPTVNTCEEVFSSSPATSETILALQVRHSDLAQYCQLCGKGAKLTLGSDITHTMVNLSISQLPVAVRKSIEPDHGHRLRWG